MIGFEYKNARFSVPDDFVDVSQIAVARVEKGASFATNVVLTQAAVKPGTTAEAYARDAFGPRAALSNGKAPTPTPVSYGSLSGVLVEQRLEGPPALGQLQFIVVVGATAYCMTFTCLAADFERLRPLSQDIFSTLTVK